MARRRRFSSRRSFRSGGSFRRGSRRTSGGRAAAGTLRIVIEQGAATVARPGVPGMVGVSQNPSIRKAKF